MRWRSQSSHQDHPNQGGLLLCPPPSNHVTWWPEHSELPEPRLTILSPSGHPSSSGPGPDQPQTHLLFSSSSVYFFPSHLHPLEIILHLLFISTVSYTLLFFYTVKTADLLLFPHIYTPKINKYWHFDIYWHSVRLSHFLTFFTISVKITVSSRSPIFIKTPFFTIFHFFPAVAIFCKIPKNTLFHKIPIFAQNTQKSEYP